MSLGYAEKLSFREDLGGQLGAPELLDSEAEVEAKVQRLAQLVSGARRIVAFTGAGISTACGIPDFRGPNGIWTLQRAGQPLPKPKVSFTHAKPSLTHQVLVALQRSGKLTYLVSQNVDGMHLRSGIPRASLAELHGNCFAERCHACGTEYIRDFEVETVGFKRTGRKCSQPGCNAALKDHILDWEDALPKDELQLSEEAAREADLAVCLGTSLQITPACNLPLKTTRVYKGGSRQAPGQLVIVNLQKTQHDNKAVKSGGLVLHARCDDVMARLAARLGLAIPPYVRRDAVLVGHQQHSPSVPAGLVGLGGQAVALPAPVPGAAKDEEASKGGSGSSSSSSNEGSGGGGGRRSVSVPFSVFVQSPHGPKCPMPMVQRVDFAFEDPHLQPASVAAPPFVVRRTARRPGPVRVRLTLHLHEAADADKRAVALSYCAELQAGLPARSSLHQQRHEFTTQVLEYGGTAADQQQQQQQPPAAGGEAAADGSVADGPADVKPDPGAAGVQPDPAAAAEAQELEAEQLLKKQRIT